MSTRRVFVTVDDGIWDLSALSQWGDERIAFASRTGVHPDEVEERTAVLTERAQAMFAGFNPETDYLALVGDPLIISIAVAAIVAQGCPKIPVLKFDRLERGYYAATIDMSSTYRRMDHGCQGSNKEEIKGVAGREAEGWAG